MITNILNSPYSKHFKPNSTIYNTYEDTSAAVPSINPLTGQRVSTTNLTNKTKILANESFSCILEYQRSTGTVSEKQGINAGEALLQGRFYQTSSGQVSDSPNYLYIPTWYKPGGRYYLDSEYLGTGFVYALEQISSMFDAEKYFGLPLLMKFVRLDITP